MVAAVKKHVWILYQNRIVAYSTTSLVFPYLLVNYSSSIFYNFLYIDIELHGGAQLHRVQKVDANRAHAGLRRWLFPCYNFFMNVYYGCLYAYAGELFIAQGRGPKTGLASVLGAIRGALFSVVAYFFVASSGSQAHSVVCLVFRSTAIEPSGKDINLARSGNRSDVILSSLLIKHQT
ncbi:hypothetical protein KL925_004727 [Ogataea polymorpha]|nr:hypothetical protein KL925_004727 [Ogataea polymorpha]